MNTNNQSCIEACMECARVCEECCAACIDENHPECIKLTGDCAQMCWNTASFLGRGSQFAGYLVKACEEACEATAKECGSYQDSEHHMRCAEACRHCADECRKIVGVRMPGMDTMRMDVESTQHAPYPV